MMHVCRLHSHNKIPYSPSITLQHCAQTLLEFNGGASCVQVYVNQHDFFISNSREGRVADDTTLYVPVSTWLANLV